MARRLISIRHRDLHPGPHNPAKRRLLPRSRAVLGCAVATVLIAGGVAPANADRLKQTDAAGDMTAFTESDKGTTTSAPAPNHHAGDVTSAELRHGRHAVTIKLTFAQLRRSHTNFTYGKLRAGTGTRWYFVEDGFDVRPSLYVASKRFECRAATLKVDYQANMMAIRVPRECLDRPNWVKATATSANSPGIGSNTFYVDDAFSATPVDAKHRATWTARVRRG